MRIPLIKILSNSFLNVILFIYIYVPSFAISEKITTVLIPFLVVIYSCYFRNKVFMFLLLKMKTIKILSLGILFIFLYSLAIDLSSSYVGEIEILASYSINFLRFYLSVIVTSISLYLIFDSLNKGSPDKLIESFFVITSIQFFVCILMLLNQEIRNYINFNLIRFDQKILSDLSDVNSFYDFRGGYGLASEQLFSFPLFNAWVASISLFLSLRKNIYYILFVPISIIPAILNARVSMIFIPCFLLSFFLLEKRKFLNLRFLSKIFVYFLLFVLFFFLCFTQLINYLPEKTSVWMIIGFADLLKTFSFGIINIPIVETLGFRDTSESLLQSHLLFPDNITSLFLGEGKYIFANQYSDVQSDIGYVRLIFFGGLVFLTAIVFVFIGFLSKVLVKTRNKVFQEILLSGILLILIGNIKGGTFGNNALLRGIFLFAIFVLLNSKEWGKILKRVNSVV